MSSNWLTMPTTINSAVRSRILPRPRRCLKVSYRAIRSQQPAHTTTRPFQRSDPLSDFPGDRHPPFPDLSLRRQIRAYSSKHIAGTASTSPLAMKGQVPRTLLAELCAQAKADPELPRPNPTTSFWQLPPHPSILVPGPVPGLASNH